MNKSERQHTEKKFLKDQVLVLIEKRPSTNEEKLTRHKKELVMLKETMVGKAVNRCKSK